ncbi:MAG: uracil-DNA glycosylase family protein [Bacteroidales bacterium]|nr:uracil-DNA glycosylase family protein [Bacteroidales bacterium]
MKHDSLEQHPLEPFVPDGAKLLILGSFPPPRNKWSMEFFYPNFINDFWRICGLVFFRDKDHFIAKENGMKLKRFDKEKIVEFCSKKGIALYDTASAVRRLKGNASDNFLEVATPTDISALLSSMPECRAIAVTGQKALETFLEANHPCLSVADKVCASDADFISQSVAENVCSSDADGISQDSGMKLLAVKDIKIGEAVPILIRKNTTDQPQEFRRVMFFRMPSTSRAYPLPLEKKAEHYRKMFHQCFSKLG